MASKASTKPVKIHRSTRQRRFGVRLCAAVFSIALSFSAISPSYAQGSDAQRRAAIAEAMSKAGGYGKVLSVKPHQSSKNTPGFRIRILTDGRVRTFDIPAQRS